MARLSNASPLSLSNVQSFDQSSAGLGSLLAQLQKSMLHPDPARERRLRTDEYERAKLGSNLEYARNTLTKLEQEAMAILASRRRAEAQTDLNAKRELLDSLLDRLQDYNKMAADNDEQSDDGASDSEDILAGVIHTPSESQASTVDDQPTATVHSPEPASATTQAPTATTATQVQPTRTTQTLRARTVDKASLASKPNTPDSTATSYASARAALFARRPGATTPTSPDVTSTATAEAILDRQAAEREDLSAKVFQMAKAMKKQQLSIYESLETEKDVLARTTEGMEKTGRGMEVARGRMGLLQRMSEGTGFLGRMQLYAMVYGLMVALLLLVFALPKLRP